MQCLNIAYQSARTQTLTNNFGFEVLPQALVLAPSVYARLQRLGELALSIQTKLTGRLAEHWDDPQFGWLKEIMSASVPEELKGLLAKTIKASQFSAPLGYFRLDVLPDGTIAEIQCPGTGWGFAAALEDHYGLPANTLSRLAELISGRKAVWWLYNTNFKRSVDYLVQRCQEQGLDLTAPTSEDFNPADSQMELVVKRPPLPELLESEKGRQLIERWLSQHSQGLLEIQPPPSMVAETKYNLALLFHPQTRNWFTDEERGICQPTYLIQNSLQVVAFEGRVDWQPVSLYNLPFFGRSRRRVVVKYGGARKYLRYGGHGVEYLGEVTSGKAEECLGRALRDYLTRREAWIIQPFVDGRQTVDGFGKYHFIYRPGYVGSDLTSIILNYRKTWKVHGASDCIWGLARLPESQAICVTPNDLQWPLAIVKHQVV